MKLDIIKYWIIRSESFMDWKYFQKVFEQISRLDEGLSKSTSGYLSVSYQPYDKIEISLGAYEIPTWSRHHHVGTFSNNKEAIKATRMALITAFNLVQKDSDISLFSFENKYKDFPELINFLKESKIL